MDLFKSSIKNLKGYEPYTPSCHIKLDANEGKNMIFQEGLVIDRDLLVNFYPDNDAASLRREIGKYIGEDPSKIIAGNGSSEMIELILKTFVDKNEMVLSFIPTFSMYKIYSQIYSAKFIGFQSRKDFGLDVDAFINKIKEVNPKVIILCNPNNPTGYLLDKGSIKKILDNTQALVVVDEAYMEFAEGTMINEISNYHNLVVLRTLSKAFGLAGIRLGYMVSNEAIINVVTKVKSPYNLNSLTQYIGINALEQRDKVIAYIENVKWEREKLYLSMKEIGVNVYKSYGNFLFFNSPIAKLQDKLMIKGILIRSFSGKLKDYYRVSIGDEEENSMFIEMLKEIINNEII